MLSSPPAATPINTPWARVELPNGLVIVAVENPTADVVAARFFVRPGMGAETAGRAGLTHLLTSVLTKGTRHHLALAIAHQVESLGASLGAEANADYWALSLKSVSGDFAELLPLASEVLRHPTFPDSEVAREQQLTLQSLRMQQEQPFSVAYDQLRRALYGDHPYAFSSLGSSDSIAALTPDDLRQYHATWTRPAHTVVSIAGRMPPQALIDTLAEALADWTTPPVPFPQLAAPAGRTPGWLVYPQDTQQVIVMLGYLGPSVWSPDYAAVKVLSTYLGNGLSSRLFVELREKRGLAYEVSAFYPTRQHPAAFGVYLGTAPGNTALALDSLQAEMDRLWAAPLPEEELAVAKSKLLGQYALGKQTSAQIAHLLGWYETLGLGLGFDQAFQAAVASVTPEMAHAAACRYLRQPWISLVGPAGAVESLRA